VDEGDWEQRDQGKYGWDGHWLDNVFIERLWRRLKVEKTWLWSYETILELKEHIDEWVSYDNQRRKQ
jgi:putative transposase